MLVWGLISLGAHFSFREPPRFLPAGVDRVVGALIGAGTGLLASVIITVLISYAISVPWPQNNGLRESLEASMNASFLQSYFTGMIPVVASTLEPWLPRGLPAFFLFR
jgi:hypothetical protein